MRPWLLLLCACSKEAGPSIGASIREDPWQEVLDSGATGYDAGPDEDGDGWGAADCDDGDADVHPLAPEVCDGQDNDCDQVIDEQAVGSASYDADGDGFGDGKTWSEACPAPPHYSNTAGDCDDSNENIHPGAEEICGDKVDDDCSGSLEC